MGLIFFFKSLQTKFKKKWKIASLKTNSMFTRLIFSHNTAVPDFKKHKSDHDIDSFQNLKI